MAVQNYPIDRDEEDSPVLRIMYARPQLKPIPAERHAPGPFSPRDGGGRGRGRFSDRPGRGRGDADGGARPRADDGLYFPCVCCYCILFPRPGEGAKGSHLGHGVALKNHA